jgi:electron transfer flavoprotein alpha/beta subunit
MRKQFVALKVDEQTHDAVISYVERMEASKGESVTVSDVVNHLLACADVEAPAVLDNTTFKRGNGAPRKYYTRVEE